VVGEAVGLSRVACKRDHAVREVHPERPGRAIPQPDPVQVAQAAADLRQLHPGDSGKEGGALACRSTDPLESVWRRAATRCAAVAPTEWSRRTRRSGSTLGSRRSQSNPCSMSSQSVAGRKIRRCHCGRGCARRARVEKEHREFRGAGPGSTGAVAHPCRGRQLAWSERWARARPDARRAAF
jgi:hypothetical protein